MQSKMNVKDLDLYYGDFKALHNINLDIRENEILSFIGPSGCGKSTLLKCLNRMNDLVVACRIEGEITLDGEDIYAKNYDVNKLRKRVGMVFQQPNPFPMSIYENIAYGPKTHGIKNKTELDEIVESSLKQAAISVNPEVILMDEPTSALDPISTGKIEDLAQELKEQYTIVMVTHNMQQASRISDKTAFFLHGVIVEYGNTIDIFTNPREEKTELYVTGRFG